ncbi:hypothetical protein V8C26DRAFT_410288 [Trichoderma gracile]
MYVCKDACATLHIRVIDDYAMPACKSSAQDLLSLTLSVSSFALPPARGPQHLASLPEPLTGQNPKTPQLNGRPTTAQRRMVCGSCAACSWTDLQVRANVTFFGANQVAAFLSVELRPFAQLLPIS